MNMINLLFEFLKQYLEVAPEPTPTCIVPEPVKCTEPYFISALSTLTGLVVGVMANIAYRLPTQNASTATSQQTYVLQPEDIESLESSDENEEYSQEGGGHFIECDLR
jgi:hypothetical protein